MCRACKGIGTGRNRGLSRLRCSCLPTGSRGRLFQAARLLPGGLGPEAGRTGMSSRRFSEDGLQVARNSVFALGWWLGSSELWAGVSAVGQWAGAALLWHLSGLSLRT